MSSSYGSAEESEVCGTPMYLILVSSDSSESFDSIDAWKQNIRKNWPV